MSNIRETKLTLRVNTDTGAQLATRRDVNNQPTSLGLQTGQRIKVNFEFFEGSIPNSEREVTLSLEWPAGTQRPTLHLNAADFPIINLVDNE